MDSEELTPFQLEVEQEITAVLSRAGVPSGRREVLSGVIPFDSPKRQTAVHLAGQRFEIWLFDDEANVVIDSNESRFERPDFDSVAALQAAVLDTVRSGFLGPACSD